MKFTTNTPGLLPVLGVFFLFVPGLIFRVPPGVLLALLAVVWLCMGWRLRAHAWSLCDLPVSKIAAAAAGEDVFAGEARAHEPVTAPISGELCAWYRVDLEQKAKDWRLVSRDEPVNGFWLRDDTGTIWVATQTAVLQHVALTEVAVPHAGAAQRRVEQRIREGEGVTVLGPVVEWNNTLVVSATSDTHEFVITADGDGSSRAPVVRRAAAYARGAWVSYGLGLGAALLAPIVHVKYVPSATARSGERTDFVFHGSARFALALAIVYLAVLALSWLPRLYNRLVAVRNQAEKAWSSIEVQLQRRHDLIDNLVTVVKRYAGYEADRLATVSPAGALPSDEQVRAASAQNASEHERAEELLALAEASPALKADAEFTRLSSTLADTESRIAYSRQFYNDAVTVFRDRRATFPYVLIAWLVTIPSFELFGNKVAPLGTAALVD